MKIDGKFKPHQVLALAIRSEIEAAGIYSRLLKKVRNIILKEKLRFLILEEKKHRQTLEKIHRQRFSDKKLLIPGSAASRPAPAKLAAGSSVMDLFNLALEKEKAAEAFYRDASKKIGDPDSRKILEYLSRVEKSHFFMIRSEIGLLEEFPGYYDVEEFHLGHDLVHVGP